MAKITISKTQWQSIGEQAGWIKTASANTIQQTLQSKFPGFYKILAGMPGFSQALNVVEQIRSGVNPEQLGINQNIIDQANAWITKVKSGQRQSSIQRNIREADTTTNVLIIAAIIIILLFAMLGTKFREWSEAKPQEAQATNKPTTTLNQPLVNNPSGRFNNQ